MRVSNSNTVPTRKNPDEMSQRKIKSVMTLEIAKFLIKWVREISYGHRDDKNTRSLKFHLVAPIVLGLAMFSVSMGVFRMDA